MNPIVIRSLGASQPVRPSAAAGTKYGTATAAVAVTVFLRNCRRETWPADEAWAAAS
jgi:hypothetical protein